MPLRPEASSYDTSSGTGNCAGSPGGVILLYRRTIDGAAALTVRMEGLDAPQSGTQILKPLGATAGIRTW